MPAKQHTRRKGLKSRRHRRTLRDRRRQRGGQGLFDLPSWLSAVRAHMATIGPDTTITDLVKPEFAISADGANRAFLEDAARVRAALILVVLQVKDDIVHFDGPLASVFQRFCSETNEESVAFLNGVENRLRGTDTTVNICDASAYPLYIWYVAANTSPDIHMTMDFITEVAAPAPAPAPAL